MDDVIVNKAAAIERCIARIRQEYGGNPRNLQEDVTRQDSIILNLQRACEASIDLAMHLVRKHALGAPQDSREAFDLLSRAKLLDDALATKLKKMVGFRNLAVRDYQSLDLAIVRSIVERELGDVLAFSSWALAQAGLANGEQSSGKNP